MNIGGNMLIERLSHNNLNEFNELLNESKDTSLFKFDFYDYYLKKSFIVKYFIRKNVKLIAVDGKYVGYIWFDFKTLKTLTINDLYIRKQYVEYLNSYILSAFDCDYVIFETYETSDMIQVLSCLNMKRIRNSNLMKYQELNNSISEEKQKYINNSFISFVPYIKNEHSKIRCYVQNEIFKNENRNPLSVDDIYYDERQDYFLDNMSLFMKLKDKYIGYGQIIFMRGIYMIVNFGIIKNFRSKGYGNILLNKLISYFSSKVKDDIYIRVDSNNVIAKKLYEKSGFVNVGTISTWLYTNNK